MDLIGDWTDILMRLGLGTLVGLALGFDREMRGIDAGLRTHGLVALSSATLTVSSFILFEQVRGADGDSDPLRVVQGLAQAIGFIAGGLIFVRGGGVMNMTTAASVWTACVAGIAAGAGQFALLGIASAMAIILLSVVGAMERFLPKRKGAVESEDERTTPPNRRGRNDPSEAD
jgi:putative Mg2+ transporter-C (MgtC) family protein